MSGVLQGARRATLADGRPVTAWSREAVAQRLAEAARTLKALPAAGCFPRGLGARWPEVVRGFWEVWNALEGEAGRRRFAAERNHRPATPGAAAIDAMDEALGWLGWLEDRRHARLLWGLALGARPGRLAQELGVSRQTAHAWSRQALERIALRLNQPGGY